MHTSWDKKAVIIGGNKSNKLAGVSGPCPPVLPGEVATYYYEFSILDEDLLHYIGLSTVPVKKVKFAHNLKVWLMLRKSESGNGVDFLVPNGKQEPKLVYSVVEPDPDAYYCVWMVMDWKKSCCDIYIKETRGRATEDDLVARGLSFSQKSDDPIQSFTVMSRFSGQSKKGSLVFQNFAYAQGRRICAVKNSLVGGLEISNR
ncbi:hypothetical protein [Persicirhabdus sediminis]|uniref:Uncharacterized protein n=1 Tax=Persicirhabdus sediminis TaxID=454144 RepID=A0A8J7SIE0_9BACT|nr:hypothetical protein [Persicirhabdus sediminis]MBK1790376.1 hypothetical protein [Persicirhabdus sediminis]